MLFKKTRKLTRLSPVLIHTNYLINLAAADEALLLKSIASFREEVERAIVLGVDYVVLHPGSARGSCEADAIGDLRPEPSGCVQRFEAGTAQNSAREHCGPG